MAFNSGNPVVGGTVLRRAAIESPNFVTGVSGWEINQDGSAEFNNLTIRGTFDGTDFVINSSGAFFYSGTPALGNLIISIASSSGTDSFGNTFPEGISVGAVGSQQVQLILSALAAALAFPSGASFEQNEAELGAGVGGTSPAQFIQLLILGAATTTAGAHDRVFAEFNSANADNSSDANLQLVYQGSNGTPHLYTTMDASGFKILAGQVTGANPSATPVVPETWHTMSLTGSTTAGNDINGTSYPPAYQLSAQGDLKLRGVVVSAAGGLASGTTFATLPTGYRPATNIPTCLVSNGNHGTLAHVYIRPNGNLQFNVALGATTSMFLDCTLNIQGT